MWEEPQHEKEPQQAYEPQPMEEPAAKPKHHAKQSTEEIAENVSDIEQEIQSHEPPVQQYIFPPVALLKKSDNKTGDSRQHLQETANKLQTTLKNFGVNVTITNISCGPAVTRYELQPEMGVKSARLST